DADRRAGERGRGRPGAALPVRVQRRVQEAVRRGPARGEDPEHRRGEAGRLTRDRQRTEKPARSHGRAFPRAAGYARVPCWSHVMNRRAFLSLSAVTPFAKLLPVAADEKPKLPELRAD